MQGGRRLDECPFGPTPSALRHKVADAAGTAADKTSVPVPEQQRTSVRSDAYRLIAEMKKVEQSKQAPPEDKIQAEKIHKNLSGAVEDAPWWVRILSALCLGGRHDDRL